MSYSPFQQAETLHVGTVDSVSPDRIDVLLDVEAPGSVALNTGFPRQFPRVNGYLLIPIDDRLLVGQVEWISIERSAFPKRQGMRDFGLVDLPFPLRRLRLNPLGTLRYRETVGPYFFTRGADALPTVGEKVILPTTDQLKAIVESGEYRRVKIGTSSIAGDAEVFINPDRLFGRHLAVLGNTGSGKSCSVAGLIRWSLEQARHDGTLLIGPSNDDQSAKTGTNARFVVLDPNGEYATAFDGIDPCIQPSVFAVRYKDHQNQLKVPLWFWNSSEWASFVQASSRTQRPVIMQALRFARDGSGDPVPDGEHEMRRFLRTIVTTLRVQMNQGNPWAGFPKSKGFYELLETWRRSFESDLDKFDGEKHRKLSSLIRNFENLCAPRRQTYHYDFTFDEVRDLSAAASDAHATFGGQISDFIPADPDAPIPFEGESFVRSVEAAAEMLNVVDYVETLIVRIRGLLSDTRMNSIMGDAENVELGQWLEDYVGSDDPQSSCVSVIDLSLVPTDIIHLVTAVIARMIFEAHQRQVKVNGSVVPAVLVMEEAHTFIKRYRSDVEYSDTATVCCQAFERIAREGRKFGLGLVVSSQRPSELSPAVLSQCNTFLLHRISNDRDQDYVQRLVPDNLRGLLRELPSLPTQNAILLGWATEIPVLVKMNDLPEEHRPRSEDPEFWKVWTGEKDLKVDWKAVANDWAGTPNPQSTFQEEDADQKLSGPVDTRFDDQELSW